jgi:broad specificity phosphatase PhoE
MELIFVRHGQVEGPGVNRSPDPALTDVGKRQAECLAESAKTWRKPTRIWTSPTLRTRQTAQPLADLFGVTPTVTPWLEEIKITRGQYTSAEGALMGMATGQMQGESMDAFYDRLTGGLTSALGEVGISPAKAGKPPTAWKLADEKERIILVGHGGSNAVALEYLLGIAAVPWTTFRFGFVHAATSTLRAFKLHETWVFGLSRHGNVAHLPAELRSY